MNKIDKFRGKLEVEVNNETYILDSLKVNDLFDLLLLSSPDRQENNFLFGCSILYRIFSKTYSNDLEGLEGFIMCNYVELLEGLFISLGWTSKNKIKEAKETRESPKKVQTGIEAIKARAAMEADSSNIEEKYITTCYVLMREFKYTWEYILDMPATVFLIIIDEMNKQAKKEQEEMNKSRRKK